MLWMAKPAHHRQMAEKGAVWIACILTVIFGIVELCLIWIAYTAMKEDPRVIEFTDGAGLSFLGNIVIADMLVITTLYAALLAVFILNYRKFNP